MTKKILTVLAIVSIAAMMMLSSCTSAGVECGLIGKWTCNEYWNNERLEENLPPYIIDVEITADDKITVVITTDYGFGEEKSEKIVDGTIESVSDKEITYKDNGVKKTIKYSDLCCDEVKFDGDTYWKIY